MNSVMQADFTSSQDVRDGLTLAFKDIEDGQAVQFLNLVNCSELGLQTDRHLSDEMRKCFPYNSSIEFVHERREDKWDQHARELW